jgi:DMAP1-binding Domain
MESQLGAGLPAGVRSQLAQIELDYQQGELTQRGYEVRRARLLAPLDMSGLHIAADSPNGILYNSAVGR